MSSKNNITRGGLSGKMGGYQPVPPQAVWEGVSLALRGKRSNRKLFILLGTAAGLALAITVGITLFSDAGQPGIVMHDEGLKNQPAAATMDDSSAADTGSAARTTDPPDTDAGALTRTRKPTDTGPAARTKKSPARFEEKVISAFQEVQEEKQAEGELIAENGEVVNGTGTKRAGQGPTEPGRDADDAGEDRDGQATQMSADTEQPVQEADQSVTDRQQAQARKETEDKEREGRTEIQQQREIEQQQENSKRTEVVNEDSLVKLLQGEATETMVTEKRKNRKWQLGATLSPLISYRDVASVDAAQNVAVNHSESARLTYAGGLQVSYLPTDRLTIETGIHYNKMGVNIGEYSNFKSGWFETELDMVSAPSRSESVVSISNSMGTVVSVDNDLFLNSYAGAGTLTDYHLLTPEEMVVADASVESFSQTFEYLEIPFNVRYKLLDRTFDLQLMGGFSTNLLVNNSVSAIAGDKSIAIGEVQDVRTFNYSGNAGVGIVYDAFENFSLSVEPRFRYYLNSINTANLPVTRPYSFGFYTGVNYRF